jgi:hypothetical protein
MSGIIDKKERVLDVVITEYGRREMAKGGFIVEFVSFSDRSTDYKTIDGTTIDIEGSSVISFEAFSAETDIIIPEIDNNGDFVLTSQLAPNIRMKDGVLEEFQVSSDGYSSGYIPLNNFDLKDYSLNTSKDRFESLKILKDQNLTKPLSLEENGSLKFIDPKTSANTIEQIPPISLDHRFGRSLVTKKMPPVVYFQGEEIQMGPGLGPESYESEAEIFEEISEVSTSFDRIDFGEEGKKYDILGQIFMKKNGFVQKLFIAEVEEFFDEDGQSNAKIYHCGNFFKKNVEGTDMTVSKFTRTLSLIFHNGDY